MKKLALLSVFICFSTLEVQAQTTVVFNVNLQPMLKDSTFIPGRDAIRITGNFYPITSSQAAQLVDKEPIDSVYTVEIRFPNRYDNQELQYNYVIITPEEEKKESMPRKLRLRGQKTELPALYFNAFAW